MIIQCTVQGLGKNPQKKLLVSVWSYGLIILNQIFKLLFFFLAKQHYDPTSFAIRIVSNNINFYLLVIEPKANILLHLIFLSHLANDWRSAMQLYSVVHVQVHYMRMSIKRFNIHTRAQCSHLA